MESEDEIKKKLAGEGYKKIVMYDDPAGEFFADHSHEADQCIVILAGSMVVSMNDKEHLLKSGDIFYFPANVVHSAKIGSEGCRYFDGEK